MNLNLQNWTTNSVEVGTAIVPPGSHRVFLADATNVNVRAMGASTPQATAVSDEGSLILYPGNSPSGLAITALSPDTTEASHFWSGFCLVLGVSLPFLIIRWFRRLTISTDV